MVCVEDFYKAIHDVHETELLQAGYKKTFKRLSNLFFNYLSNFILVYSNGGGMYHGIPRSVVDKFSSVCVSAIG